ncbi:hypothetical protein ACQP3J_33305, partial [Escherichia coli]
HVPGFFIDSLGVLHHASQFCSPLGLPIISPHPSATLQKKILKNQNKASKQTNKQTKIRTKQNKTSLSFSFFPPLQHLFICPGD